MTTNEQKASERQSLQHVLGALGIAVDEEPVGGEAPDFTLAVAGRTIGIEVTAFQSGTRTDDGVALRQGEGEWQKLEAASRDLRNARSYLDDVHAGLFFKASMPPRSAYAAFMEEIASFVRERAAELGPKGRDYWPRDFASPLMREYLRCLHLRRGQYPEWFSNISHGGWIGGPDAALTAIVTKKASKEYRPTDELWLAIQCNPRTSEMMMPIEGVADFGYVAGLEEALRASCFSRVFVLTYRGTFAWNEAEGWRLL